MNIVAQYWPLILFNALYIAIGGLYFLQDINHEFLIYVGVIIALIVSMFATLRITLMPRWMMWSFSLWGLLHILGGSIDTRDGVLFAYRIYPIVDVGGDLFILKYDQVVHAYLYGVVAALCAHVLSVLLKVKAHVVVLCVFAVMTALGISVLNEIMEFLIAVSAMENGVGGYENTMLDLMFNLCGAIVGAFLFYFFKKKERQ